MALVKAVEQARKSASVTRIWTATHVVIVLSLCSIALWDVVKIIIDYLFDNKLTLVKLVDIGDSIDFGEDAKICITFPTSVLQSVWRNSSLVTELSSQAYNGSDFVEKLRATKFNYGSYEMIDLSTEERFRIAALAGAINNADLGYLRNGVHNASFRVPNPRELAMFISDPLVARYVNSTWLGLKPHIVRQLFPVVDQDLVELDYFIDKGVCFHIPMARIMSASSQIVIYGLGLNFDSKADALKYNDKRDEVINYHIDLYFLNTDRKLLGIDIGQNSADITVQIQNFGIFRRTFDERCVDKELAASHCAFHTYIHGVQNLCNCLPFSYKHWFSEEVRAATPFCAPDGYERCIEKVKELRIRGKVCPQPCKVIRNTYSTAQTVSKEACVMAENGRGCARSLIKFVCPDNFHPSYEDRVQLTLSQFVSQLGGDLGLYTGFSLLGLWQFIVYFRNFRQRRLRRESERRENADSATPEKTSLFQLIVKYTLGLHSDTDDLVIQREISNPTIEERLKIVEQRLAAIEANARKKQNNRRVSRGGFQSIIY